MSSTNKTKNYELSQFISTDKPTWLVDYNTDMNRIDLGIKGVSDTANTNASNINLLTGRMTSAENNIVNLQASSSQHGSDITDLKAKDIIIENNIATIETNVSSLKNKAIAQTANTQLLLDGETDVLQMNISEDGIYMCSATLQINQITGGRIGGSISKTGGIDRDNETLMYIGTQVNSNLYVNVSGLMNCSNGDVLHLVGFGERANLSRAIMKIVKVN